MGTNRAGERGGRRATAEVGQYGNTRGKERQRRRTQGRMKQKRIVQALEQAREHNANLDNLTVVRTVDTVGQDHEHSAVFIGKPPRYSCCGRLVPPHVANPPAPPEPPMPPKPRAKAKPTPELPEDGDGNGAWTLGQARSVLRQGYTLAHVVGATGFGTKWFSDLPLVDGRGLPLGEEPEPEVAPPPKPKKQRVPIRTAEERNWAARASPVTIRRTDADARPDQPRK